MPTLFGKELVKSKPPCNARDEEEFFFCPETLEIFRTYEEFCERHHQISSPEWICQYCRKSRLLYSEAVECEATDLRQLAIFGQGLSRALLHISSSVSAPRLQSIVELLHNFAYSRYFISEYVQYRLNQDDTPRIGIIDAVYIDRGAGEVGSAQFVEQSSLSYGVIDYEKRREEPRIIHRVPSSLLVRRNASLLNKEKIKFFLRRTMEQVDDTFRPKDYFLEKFRLPPMGSYSWPDMFAGPEPDWQLHLPILPANPVSRIDLVRPKLEIRPRGRPPNSARRLFKHAGANQVAGSSTVGYKVVETYIDPQRIRPRQSTATGEMSGQRREDLLPQAKQPVKVSSGPQANFEAQRQARMELYELSREWGQVILHDDLHLPDLVPLPEFQPIHPRLNETHEFGQALQVVEFFHAFGPMLNMQLPQLLTPEPGDLLVQPTRFEGDGRVMLTRPKNVLTYDLLEEALLHADPAGPLADIFIALLKCIRSVENEVNSKPPSATALAASQAASAAVGNVSVGLNLIQSTAGLSGGVGLSVASSTSANSNTNCTDYGAMYTEIALADGGRMAALMRQAGFAALLNELVGVPAQLASGKAGKAAIACAHQLSSLRDDAELPPGGSETTTDTASLTVSVAKAASAAAMAGTMAEPPLDRAGLTEALWLHLVCSVAKGGGFRGNIWGGTRVLDDPLISFVRDHASLVAKLRKVQLYDLEPGEKLLLLTVLIDELLMQPQLRDQIDVNFERIRVHKLMLKQPTPTIQTGSPDVASNAPRPSLGKAGGAGRGKKSQKPLRPVTTLPVSLGLTGGCSFDDCESLPNNEPVNKTHADVFESLFELSRGSAMLCLGKDRLHRRYWLLASIPCILVEDAGPDASEEAERAELRRRLRVAAQQVPAECVLGRNPDEALSKLRALLRLLSCEHGMTTVEREAALNQVAAAFPCRMREAEFPLDKLRLLVSPPKLSRRDSARITDSEVAPAVAQVSRLVEDGVRWSLVTPCEELFDPEDCEHRAGSQTISLLEASLNPRGFREHQLRRSINQLNSILGMAVQKTVKSQFDHDRGQCKRSKPPDSCQMTLAWLHRHIDLLGNRFDFDTKLLKSPLTSISRAALNAVFEDSSERANFREALRNLEKEAARTDETSPEGLLKRAIRKLVNLCFLVDARALCGPISLEDKTLRGGIGSIMDFSSESLELEPPSADQPNDRLVSVLPSRCVEQTNGVQRWLFAVLKACTSAQLHLLARGFEQCARRAHFASRGVPSSIASFVERRGPPNTVCTACRRNADPTPNPAPAWSNGPQVPFSRCSGCAAPFHLDCLADWDARRLARARRKAPRGERNLFDAGVAGHFPLAATLGNAFSSRLETSGAALLLCAHCRADAGWAADVAVEMDVEEEAAAEEKPSVNGSVAEELEVEPECEVPSVGARKRAPSTKSEPPSTRSKRAKITLDETAVKEIVCVADEAEVEEGNNFKVARENMGPLKSKNARTSNSPVMQTVQKADEKAPSGLQSKKKIVAFLEELVACPAAKPLLKCGSARTLAHRTAKENEVASTRRGTRQNTLLVSDLSELQEKLARDELPGGPRQIVVQLKLLLAHWQTVFRPGSRLFKSAASLNASFAQQLEALANASTNDDIAQRKRRSVR